MKSAIIYFFIVVASCHFPAIAGELTMGQKMYSEFSEMAESLAESGEAGKSLALYSLMINQLSESHIKKDQLSISIVCNSLVATFKQDEIGAKVRALWTCPKVIIEPWLEGNLSLVEEQPVRRLCRAYPKYPFWAKVFRLSGEVDLKFKINESGHVEDVQLISYTRKIFIKKSIRSLKSCMYNPGKRYGEYANFEQRRKFIYKNN